MQLIQVASKCCAHEVGCFLVVDLKRGGGELLLCRSFLLCTLHEVLRKSGKGMIAGKQVRKYLELVRLMKSSPSTCVQQRTHDNALTFH